MIGIRSKTKCSLVQKSSLIRLVQFLELPGVQHANSLTCCRRYDLSCVDALEAFAAEGLAVFGGRLPDGAAALQELVLTALRANLGYRGGCVCLPWRCDLQHSGWP